MKTVLVIFGGRTPEHDVSIVSAISSVIKPLELTGRYKVEAVYIAKNGAWHWDEQLKDISTYRSGAIDAVIKRSGSPLLQLDGGLQIVKQQSLGRLIKKRIDIVFPVMHGSYGEDGSLMGLLEMAGVPYVGCGVPASALAMDKVLAKEIARARNIPTGTWTSFDATALVDTPESVHELVRPLQYPLFVKPAHAGSSIGITKVESKADLWNALEVAAHYDAKIIVEQAVPNLIEVTLPIIGNDRPIPALLEQPLTDTDAFFDFETKYMHGGKKKGGKSAGKKGVHGYSNLPAKLPSDLYARAEKVGLEVYKALGCSGIARVDMLIDSKSNTVYFNEVNPMPGSLYAHNWRASGMSGVELVTKLLAFAEEKYASSQKIQTSFSTNYLKQF